MNAFDSFHDSIEWLQILSYDSIAVLATPLAPCSAILDILCATLHGIASMAFRLYIHKYESKRREKLQAGPSSARSPILQTCITQHPIPCCCSAAIIRREHTHTLEFNSALGLLARIAAQALASHIYDMSCRPAPSSVRSPSIAFRLYHSIVSSCCFWHIVWPKSNLKDIQNTKCVHIL